MSDNANVTAGDGTIVVATDKIGGVDYQRVKATWGADGTATDVSAAAPMPVVQTGALPAGTAVIGQTSIDQTTVGTTDSVTVKASAGVGSLTETAPATDTASSGLNGRLQRIAQRLTSLIALLPSALGQTTKSASLSVSVASDDDLQGKLGSLTETAPATDTASSGLNGRLQRIAQRLTTLLAVFPTTIDTNSGSKSASTLRVVLATDQPSLTNANPASQSGTWTVQPGNTQNTTPWLASPLATSIDVTVTRPSDTNAYTANDELSSSTSAPTVNTITSAARTSGGTVRLVSARCVDSANQSTKPQLVVFVFDTTTTPNNDNAAFAPADSVLNTCVAILPFNAWYPGDDTIGASGNAIAAYTGPALSIKTSGSANLFFRVKVLNAYTPVSAEAFVFRFDFLQD